MTTTQKSYVGDTGTAIILDCGQDISAASARSIHARKPDNTVVTWPAIASGSNSIRFDTLADTLDQPGTWRLQAHVTLPTGEWSGATAELLVYAAFR